MTIAQGVFLEVGIGKGNVQMFRKKQGLGR
jgi:hypothetical protein